MFKHTDQLDNTIALTGKPLRVISVVPSQSEFLWDIGVRDELVGITRFCIHPDDMYRSIERVGGTKNLNIGKIRALQPDLIIGNKEENDRAQIEELQKEFNVWMSDIYNFDDALDMMQKLGAIFEKQEEAHKIVSAIKASLPAIRNSFNGERVAYFIWNKPYMLAARNTFIDHVLNFVGLKNAAAEQERYPEVSSSDLKELDPDWCFLSSEPFPFKEIHATELQSLLPDSRIRIVDGEVFSWYGSRLLHLANYIQEIKLRDNKGRPND